MKVVLASQNPHKLAEMQKILGTLGMEVLLERDVGVNVEVEETGTTFAENSLLKAQAVFDATHLATVADDSGLMVDALGGAPGVYSARYGGKHTDAERMDLLLENLSGVPEEKRTAKFVCVITCLWPDGRRIVARGERPGRILTERHGSSGFGYDPVFFVPEYGMSYAELAPEVKNSISHRAAALQKFLELYQEQEEKL